MNYSWRRQSICMQPYDNNTLAFIYPARTSLSCFSRPEVLAQGIATCGDPRTNTQTNHIHNKQEKPTSTAALSVIFVTGKYLWSLLIMLEVDIKLISAIRQSTQERTAKQ